MTLSQKPLFLLDTSCGIARNTQLAPKGLIQNLYDLETLRKAKDSEIKEYLDKEDLILITSDYRFALKMVLAGKKIIFMENTFDDCSFHVIYPSIEICKSVFWRPDITKLLHERFSVN